LNFIQSIIIYQINYKKNLNKKNPHKIQIIVSRLLLIDFLHIKMTFTLWMTGLPCSGKTSISKKLSEVISNLVVLDGDELRKIFSWDDFSDEGIRENNSTSVPDG